MPLTNSQIESMIQRIDNDTAYSYEISFEEVIDFIEEHCNDIEQVCEKYKNVLTQHLARKNTFLEGKKLDVVVQQIMLRIHDLFDEIIALHNEGYDIDGIATQINYQIENDGLDNVISRLNLTEKALNAALDVSIFDIATPLLDNKAVADLSFSTPASAKASRSQKASSRLSSAKLVDGTPASIKQMDLERSTLTEIEALLQATTVAPQSKTIGLLSKLSSDTPNRDAVQVTPFNSAASFTPQFSSAQVVRVPLIDLSAEAISFLTENGFSRSVADINECTSKQYLRYTPLTLAALQINEPICVSLISAGANVNAINGVGNTPLHMLCNAVRKPNAPVSIAKKLMSLFISNGGDLTIKNNEGKTPMDLDTKHQLLESYFPPKYNLGLQLI